MIQRYKFFLIKKRKCFFKRKICFKKIILSIIFFKQKINMDFVQNKNRKIILFYFNIYFYYFIYKIINLFYSQIKINYIQ